MEDYLLYVPIYMLLVGTVCLTNIVLWTYDGMAWCMRKFTK